MVLTRYFRYNKIGIGELLLSLGSSSALFFGVKLGTLKGIAKVLARFEQAMPAP